MIVAGLDFSLHKQRIYMIASYSPQAGPLRILVRGEGTEAFDKAFLKWYNVITKRVRTGEKLLITTWGGVEFDTILDCLFRNNLEKDVFVYDLQFYIGKKKLLFYYKGNISDEVPFTTSLGDAYRIFRCYTHLCNHIQESKHKHALTQLVTTIPGNAKYRWIWKDNIRTLRYGKKRVLERKIKSYCRHRKHKY